MAGGAALEKLRGDEDEVGGDEEGDGEAAEGEREVRPGEGEQDAGNIWNNINKLHAFSHRGIKNR